MSKFSEQQQIKTEKKDRDKTSRDTLGKYFYDLSKLTFVATVLNGSTTLFSESEVSDRILNVILGIIFTALLAMIGYRTILNGK